MRPAFPFYDVSYRAKTHGSKIMSFSELAGSGSAELLDGCREALTSGSSYCAVDLWLDHHWFSFHGEGHARRESWSGSVRNSSHSLAGYIRPLDRWIHRGTYLFCSAPNHHRRNLIHWCLWLPLSADGVGSPSRRWAGFSIRAGLGPRVRSPGRIHANGNRRYELSSFPRALRDGQCRDPTFMDWPSISLDDLSMGSLRRELVYSSCGRKTCTVPGSVADAGADCTGDLVPADCREGRRQ